MSKGVASCSFYHVWMICSKVVVNYKSGLQITTFNIEIAKYFKYKKL